MFYCVLALIGLILFYWLLPETKGQTLEEVEALFSRPRNWPSLGRRKQVASPELVNGKSVQYVQIRGLNRDHMELEEEDD